MKYYNIMCIIIVFSLGCDRLGLFFHARCVSFHNNASLLTFFVYFFVLLHSCCSLCPNVWENTRARVRKRHGLNVVYQKRAIIIKARIL